MKMDATRDVYSEILAFRRAEHRKGAYLFATGFLVALVGVLASMQGLV